MFKESKVFPDLSGQDFRLLYSSTLILVLST